MFLDLPCDLQNKIYQCLKPKHRVVMKLVTPKNKSLWKNDRDRKLIVLQSFVKKHAEKLKRKELCFPHKMVEFMNDYKHDEYVKQIYTEYYGDTKEEDKPSDILLDIKNHTVSKSKCYTITQNMRNDFLSAIYRQATPVIFLELLSNETTEQLLVQHLLERSDTFIFNLVNNENESLLHFILFGEYPKKEQLKSAIELAIRYMQKASIARIFVGSGRTISLKMLLKHFNLPSETIEAMIDKSQESFDVECALVLMNWKVKQTKN